MASKITIYRGTTYNFAYNHTDTAGDPVSLANSTVYFTVKSEAYDTDATDASAAIKKTITDHDDAAGGITSWTIDDADTYINPGKYHYAVLVEDDNGHSDPPSLIGDFVVKPQPTNREVGNE